jgi:hypothetical protein
MISLGLSLTDSLWHELRNDQLWGKNISTVCSLGDSKAHDPWFWQVITPRGLSKEKENEWSLDSKLQFSHQIIYTDTFGMHKVDHVKWFCDRADRDCFHEEVQILEAKFE